MRVALVIGNYNSLGGGAERWTHQHATYLASQGINVHILARSFKGLPPTMTPIEIAASHGLNRRLRFAEAVERKLKSETFDIIHDMGEGWACDFFMPHHGVRAAEFQQHLTIPPRFLRPVVQLAHQVQPRYREFNELERRQYDLSRKTTFIPISKMVARHMALHYQVPDDRMRLVYNGIDTKRFQPGRNLSLREAIGWQDRTVFLLIAHRFARKGLATSIRALAHLKRERLPVGLIVLGNDSTARYIRLAKRLGCGESVRFAGAQPDPLPYYHAADAYVMPTLWDPCSLVALEALACGLPVITSQFNGAGELVEEEIHGSITRDPWDPRETAIAMKTWIDAQRRKKALVATRSLAWRLSSLRNHGEILGHYRKRLGINSGSSRAA